MQLNVCSAPIFEATEGETLTIPEAIPPGQVAFINVEINCEGHLDSS